jgi:type IV pilus assembly protein PilQ
MFGIPRLLRLAGITTLALTAIPGSLFAQLEDLKLKAPGSEASFSQEPEATSEATGEAGTKQEPAPTQRRGPFAHLDPNERITINFKEQELTSILELFATQYNLNLVYTSDVTGDVTLNLYQVPVPTALLQVLASNGYSFLIQDEFIRVVFAEDVVAPAVSSGSNFKPEVIFLDHVKASDVSPILTPLLAGNEQLIAGPASEAGIQITDNLGGNSQGTQELIVLYASDETLARVHALLDEIDVPPLQVLVEATILAVSLSDENKLGVDMNLLSGIDFQALSGTSNITDGVDLGSTGVGQNSWMLGGRTSGFTDSNSNGLHFGILRNQLGIFVEALESVGNTTVLSNPQVLAINRQLAEVLVGKRLPYITTSVSQTSSTQSVEFLEVGTSLVFRPFISGDGYVRMEILPKNSTGVINSQGLPEETTTQVTANVLVRSGHTVVIGGLMETRESTATEQVPFLGTLPFIGGLFKSEAQVENKTEIIVLLTPHIVGEGELERRAAVAKNRFDAARARLAASHHGYLRPSYARKMYREAALMLAKGDSEGALAKAEWGLMAMPADPDLALLAEHCHNEMRSSREEEQELRDALRILEQESAQ